MALEIPDRDANAAFRRIAIGDKGRDAVKADLDQRMADFRDAAIWNTILLAKAHGESSAITQEDVERWRAIRAITDKIAMNGNDGEAVPQGFEAAVRTRQAETLAKAAKGGGG